MRRFIYSERRLSAAEAETVLGNPRAEWGEVHQGPETVPTHAPESSDRFETRPIPAAPRGMIGSPVLSLLTLIFSPSEAEAQGPRETDRASGDSPGDGPRPTAARLRSWLDGRLMRYGIGGSSSRTAAETVMTAVSAGTDLDSEAFQRNAAFDLYMGRARSGRSYDREAARRRFVSSAHLDDALRNADREGPLGDLRTIRQAVGEYQALREELVADLASRLHDDWRRPRLDPSTGRYDPRIKPTRDQAWIAAHGGATEVDIANTAYEDLPSDWRAENRASAEVATDLVLRGVAGGGAMGPDFVERASAVIHDRWLERNPWAPAHQKQPYNALSAEDQDRDRVIVLRARSVLGRAVAETAALGIESSPSTTRFPEMTAENWRYEARRRLRDLFPERLAGRRLDAIVERIIGLMERRLINGPAGTGINDLSVHLESVTRFAEAEILRDAEFSRELDSRRTDATERTRILRAVAMNLEFARSQAARGH